MSNNTNIFGFPINPQAHLFYFAANIAAAGVTQTNQTFYVEQKVEIVYQSTVIKVDILPHVKICDFSMKNLKDHFQFDDQEFKTAEELQIAMREALFLLPNDKFISTRSLTRLDALLTYAAKKHESHLIASLLLRNVLSSVPCGETRMSKHTREFLERASQNLSSSKTLQSQLTEEYMEEIDIQECSDTKPLRESLSQLDLEHQAKNKNKETCNDG